LDLLDAALRLVRRGDGQDLPFDSPILPPRALDPLDPLEAPSRVGTVKRGKVKVRHPKKAQDVVIRVFNRLG